MEVYKSNRHIYEEEMMELVILPNFVHVDEDKFNPIRLEAIKVKRTFNSVRLM